MVVPVALRSLADGIVPVAGGVVLVAILYLVELLLLLYCTVASEVFQQLYCMW